MSLIDNMPLPEDRQVPHASAGHECHVFNIWYERVTIKFLQLVLDEVLESTCVYTFVAAVAKATFSFKGLVSGEGLHRSAEKHCRDPRTVVLSLNAAKRKNARRFWGIVFKQQLQGYGHHEWREADKYHCRDRPQCSAHRRIVPRVGPYAVSNAIASTDTQSGAPARRILTPHHDSNFAAEDDSGCRELTRPKCVTEPTAIAGGRRRKPPPPD
jgi:hypothetical protein